MEEQRRLLSNQAENTTNSSSDEEEWSDDESGSGSYYSDTDSSIPEWESSIDDTTGELLFIDCHPFVTQNNIEGPPKTVENASSSFSKTQVRRSTRGKFLRLIRSSKRRSRRPQKAPEIDTAKVKFQDFHEGEEKEVTLKMSSDNYRKSGPNGSLPELLLGLNVGTLSDGQRVMIAGFLPDSEAKHEKNIKIGDWLKSVNDVEVTYQNLNNVLDRISGGSDVKLRLQRVAGVDVTKAPPINELNCQSRFVRQLINRDKEQEQALFDFLLKHPIGLVYLDLDKLTEDAPEFDDIIYTHPKPPKESLICNSRGAFITLNHLLPDLDKNKPKTSTFLYENQLCHIIYTQFEGNKVMLLMIPDKCASLKESYLINSEILRMCEFLYETIDNCFAIDKNKIEMDNFLGRFFTRLLNNGIWGSSDNLGFMKGNRNLITPITSKFEEVLPGAITLNLPDEALMQIDDALSELEASDYREWNEEPLDCQRLFTILGSALYHSGYLLASHLIHEDLIDVHSYCRQQGLFHLSKSEPVKTLILWREAYPSSCSSKKNQKLKIPKGKRYLLIVGSGKNLLAVIMEAGGCTEPAEPNMGPDAFYVEEAQATLAHIQELGLPELADRWLAMNPGPQVTIPEVSTRKKSDFMDKSISPHLRKPEVTSILKRRNSDQAFVTHSTYSLADDVSEAHSEETASQGGQSEKSDDVAGRRRSTRYDSDEDESDDECGEGSQMSSSSFDVSELKQNLLTDVEDIFPHQLTAGNDNVLFHFIQFDATEGVLIAPPECRVQSLTLNAILDNFRECCHKIHSLFENTMRFKNMPVQDMAKSVMNKSLIAIKEQGVMFECAFLDDVDSKKNKIKYWVIGRLFYMPHPREVYVCHQDTVPQNIVELAFKMNLSVVN